MLSRAILTTFFGPGVPALSCQKWNIILEVYGELMCTLPESARTCARQLLQTPDVSEDVCGLHVPCLGALSHQHLSLMKCAVTARMPLSVTLHVCMISPPPLTALARIPTSKPGCQSLSLCFLQTGLLRR
mmetsp:Transcript_135954/g.235815  ORF Transcript_135954/g.235815 Transcript_135954/m.235815 type:complete len:130 (-) Transcript_135954:483-872(-)